MEIGLELELPGEDERDWLLDGLSRLIEKKGHEKFVEGPVLLPTDEHFPDVVEPGPRGARTLLRRLGAYAGLGELGVRVTVYERAEHAEFDHHGVGHGGEGAAAWFAGIRDGICEYGVEQRELSDPEELIGTLGHEVAHAFREHHALVVVSRDVEERLTDLTAVYLGFGIFLLNSSLSFKTGGWSPSGERLLYERRARGYLSPPQIALLLAAQAVSRETTEAERRAAGRALAPNHAKLFEDAFQLFADDAPALRRRLGVPAPAASGRAAASPAPPLSPDGADADGLVVVKATKPSAPRAFRLRRDRGVLYSVLGAGAPIVFAATGLVEGALLVGIIATCGLVGFVLGRSSRDDRCSACDGRLSRGDASCPDCHASLVATVSSDEERLTAEEALPKEHEEYDYFADSEVPDHEKAEARILTAMHTEWVMTRDLVSADFLEQHAGLVARARRGELTTPELFELYGELDLNETGRAFSDAYFDADGGWNPADYALLTTASRIRDTRASYRRVHSLLDQRFEAWQATEAKRESAAPDQPPNA